MTARWSSSVASANPMPVSGAAAQAALSGRFGQSSSISATSRSLLDMAGVVADQQGVAEQPGQPLLPFVPTGGISGGSRRDDIVVHCGQLELVGLVVGGVAAHASSSEALPALPPAPECDAVRMRLMSQGLSLIHISEPTRRTPISYAVFC